MCLPMSFSPLFLPVLVVVVAVVTGAWLYAHTFMAVCSVGLGFTFVVGSHRHRRCARCRWYMWVVLGKEQIISGLQGRKLPSFYVSTPAMVDQAANDAQTCKLPEHLAITLWVTSAYHGLDDEHGSYKDLKTQVVELLRKQELQCLPCMKPKSQHHIRSPRHHEGSSLSTEPRVILGVVPSCPPSFPKQK